MSRTRSAARTAAPFLLAVLLLSLTAQPGRAQDGNERSVAEQRLERLEAQITKDEELLSITAQAEADTEEQVSILNRQIAMREELVLSYQRHLETLNYQQDSLRTSMQMLADQLDELRSEYQARAGHAYRYGRMHDMALILAAESINQMLIRIRYLHRFAEQRRRQLFNIQEANDGLQQRRDELEESLARSQELLLAAESEQEALTKQKEQHRQLVSQLRRQRSNIEQSIARNKSAADEMSGRVRQLIAAESNRSPGSTAAANALTGSFVQSRGRLPWPVEGVIIEPFGESVHPVHGTITPNPGILVATTDPQAEVHAVFDGRVSSIDIMPDFGTVMIVEHGEYHTVYSNFSLTWVSEGDEVTSGQVLGFAGTETEPKGQALFFGLFKDGQEIDPTGWLAAR